MANKEFPRGSRDVQALRGIPEGDWNDVSDWLVCDAGMIPRLKRKNGKTSMGAEMMLARLSIGVGRPVEAWRPFLYGFAFLLLLWGCMAWENWIG